MHSFTFCSRAALLVAALAGAAFASAQCSVVKTHSGANFSGGQFVMQAGMVEGEGGAASFQLDPSEFPIKINLAESIWATQNATVSTTTVWGVKIWSGTPRDGVLIAEHVADGDILPFLQLPPGTNGTNIQFSVDPQDPDQIIVDNVSGTGIVTVGWEMVQMANPPANPCTTPPSPTMNAFMTTDTNGLAQASQNWLYAIDCPGFGAPAGWSRFSELSVFFRPTGDWNYRLTYEPLIPLSISDQPDNLNIQVGQPAVFQVVASGAGPFQYKWYKGSAPISNSSRIFGATTDSLVILNTIAGDAGSYRCEVTNACGTVFSDFATLSFGGPSVTGNVALGSWGGTVAGRTITMEAYFEGNLAHQANVTLDASGNYTFVLPSGAQPGVYNFFAKGSHWLRKLRGTVNVTASGATGVNFTLINGDVDGDNEVGPGDFGALATAFLSVSGDPNWNVEADLDGDGEVGPGDFGILATNFLTPGD